MAVGVYPASSLVGVLSREVTLYRALSSDLPRLRMNSSDLRLLSMYPGGGERDLRLDLTRSYLGDRDRDLERDLNLL